MGLMRHGRLRNGGMYSRMLKKSASSVLASFRPSTYPSGYASALHSLRPCWTAFLSILREYSPVVPDVRAIKIPACQPSFSKAAKLTRGCLVV
jgi:hypothetical protein